MHESNNSLSFSPFFFFIVYPRKNINKFKRAGEERRTALDRG
jgi:hypothetical protein